MSQNAARVDKSNAKKENDVLFLTDLDKGQHESLGFGEGSLWAKCVFKVLRRSFSIARRVCCGDEERGFVA